MPPTNPRQPAADRSRRAEQQGAAQVGSGAPGAGARWVGRITADRRNESVSVLGDGLDEARIAGAVAKGAAQRLDALGERFVGDRDPAPHLGQEAVLGDQCAGLAHEQGERVEVARVELDGDVVAGQPAVTGVKPEAAEADMLRHHRCDHPSRPNVAGPRHGSRDDHG